MQSVCYIVGAAPLDGRLPQMRAGDLLIAADAGITALTAAGVTPDLVIGDFDSLGAPPEHPNAAPTYNGVVEECGVSTVSSFGPFFNFGQAPSGRACHFCGLEVV